MNYNDHCNCKYNIITFEQKLIFINELNLFELIIMINLIDNDIQNNPYLSKLCHLTLTLTELLNFETLNHQQSIGKRYADHL